MRGVAGLRIALLLLVVGFAPTLAFAQGPAVDHSSHASPHSQPPNVPVLVDGAKHPERIPDELAYAHFVQSLALPVKPSLEQTRMRNAALAAVQLAPSDGAAFIVALEGLHSQLSFIDRESERLLANPTTTSDRITDLTLSRTRALSEAHMRVVTRLSPVGRERLAKYIRGTVKKNIVVYGDSE